MGKGEVASEKQQVNSKVFGDTNASVYCLTDFPYFYVCK